MRTKTTFSPLREHLYPQLGYGGLPRTEGEPVLLPTIFSKRNGTGLVAQWLRIHLAMQGPPVRSLVWEDPTWRGAISLWTTDTEACVPLEPVLHGKRSHHNEKPKHCNKDPVQPKINIFFKEWHRNRKRKKTSPQSRVNVMTAAASPLFVWNRDCWP